MTFSVGGKSVQSVGGKSVEERAAVPSFSLSLAVILSVGGESVQDTECEVASNNRLRAASELLPSVASPSPFLSLAVIVSAARK